MSRLRQYSPRMFCKISRLLALASCLFVVGCSSSGSLARYQRPLSRQAVQRVRTTAYTHSEADHLRHGRSTALGTTLQSGNIKSAAADWSRWPVGSVFRIRETGELYQVDDYGRALAGTNTIDLYKPSRSAMNQWGVRNVTIENLRWGSVERSLSILRPRSKYKHIRRMIDQIEDRYANLKRKAPTVDDGTLYGSASPAPTQRPTFASGGVPLTPFSTSFSR